jgi:hypothetical protein
VYLQKDANLRLRSEDCGWCGSGFGGVKFRFSEARDCTTA